MSIPDERLTVADKQALRIGRTGAVWIGILLLIFAVLLGRIAQLKIDPPEQLATVAGEPYSSVPEYARRGDILDREGRVVATSSIGYRLFVDPHIVADIYTISLDIANIIGGDPAEYDQLIFARPNSRYVVLNHLVTDSQAEAIRHAGLRGVGLAPRLVREYTNEDIGSQVVGMVGFEHAGLGGMEMRFDDRLERVDGRLHYLRDANGEPLWIDPAGFIERDNGDDVRLSIDLVMQEIVERRLQEAVEEVNAGGGRMLVVDVESGEILAMADLLRSREGWEEYTEDPIRAVHPSLGRNRCATDLYEPGSTFKPFIWSVATERGKASLSEVLQTPYGPPGLRMGRRIIRDSHYYGPSTWEKVLVKSMNTGMAIVAERFSHSEMQDVLAGWGFGAATGTGIPGEERGFITSPKNWNNYSQQSVAYGHEISVTPLQMVQAFCAFARDGSMPQLRMTAVEDAAFHVPVVRQVIHPDTARLTRTTLRKVMLHGTGRRAQSDKYRLWGKSGTAQLYNQEAGGYFENRYVSSFIAGAPFNQPRIVVLCVMDDPDRSLNHWGGEVAGRPVRDVVDAVLEYMGVPHDVVDLTQEAIELPLNEPPASAGSAE